jgi:NifB/MoaA-like Fe-S oxidoreductase
LAVLNAGQEMVQLSSIKEETIWSDARQSVTNATLQAIMAQRDIPKYKEYEDFPQIENGVGLIALFKKEFDDYFSEIKKDKIVLNKKREVAVISGASAYKFIKELCSKLENYFDNLKINVYCIVNEFFGETVTVTGLITGIDIIKQLKDKELGEELLIPKCMLRYETTVFLDDVTTKDLEEELNIKVRIDEVNGCDFINGILNLEN